MFFYRIDFSRVYKKIFKYMDIIIFFSELMDFIDDVQDVEINKGVLTHKGVNVSEIAFIKKK